MVTGTTTSTVTLNWDDNAESDLDFYTVFRSTDNVNFGSVTTVTSSTYVDTGRNADTTYWYTVSATDTSANPSAQSSSVSGTTQAFGAAPYDINTIKATSVSRPPPAWVSSFQFPTAPTTAASVTASTIGALQSAVGVDGNEITIPAGTYSGSITVSGDDIDIIMSNNATIQGSVVITGSRIRWTGGNFVGTGGGDFSVSGSAGGVYDLLLNDISVIADANANNFSGGRDRIVVINSTLDQQGSTVNRWAF